MFSGAYRAGKLHQKVDRSLQGVVGLCRALDQSLQLGAFSTQGLGLGRLCALRVWVDTSFRV